MMGSAQIQVTHLRDRRYALENGMNGMLLGFAPVLTHILEIIAKAEKLFPSSHSCLNLKESLKLSNKQNPLGSCESPNYKKSTGSSLVVAASKIDDVPYTSDNYLDGVGSKPAKDQLMLIDGTPVIYRAYYKIMSNLHHGGLQHADGNGDWVLNIFKSLSLMLDMLDLSPSHAAVIFDYDGEPCCYKPYHSNQQISLPKGSTFRHSMYPAYKGNRIPTPDTVIQAFQYLKAALAAMSIKVIQVPGVEADDVIGTLAMNGVAAGLKVQIVSPDKDFFQLLCPSIRLLRMAPRGSQVVSFGIEEFSEKFGDLKPSQFVDVTALAGDASDNIPGVDGIDLTNALQLIIKFGSLENLLQNLDLVAEGAIREALISNNGQALLSKDLATLRCNLPFCMVPFKISDLLFKKPEDQGEKFINLLRAMSAFAEAIIETISNKNIEEWG
ncbi:hypothetical protein SUGI_0486060 [Cryptomeria japonica]|nr:hypothetical protein SUGI_0486060 [Cryptomeria japonica]